MIFKKVRLAWKRLVVATGFGSRLIEFCYVCGRRQPLVWWADDPIWNAVDDGRDGIYCPECFDREADKRKIFLRWRPTVHEASTRQV